MKFNNLAELMDAVKKLPRTKKGRVRYTIMFKKAVVEMFKEKKLTYSDLNKISLANSTIYNWVKKYDDDLYSMEGACTVSPIIKKANKDTLAQLKKQVKELNRKIKLIEQVKAMGYTVS